MKKFIVFLGAVTIVFAMVNAQNNVSNIYQTGNNQDAIVSQAGGDNESNVNQEGKRNTALVSQQNMMLKANNTVLSNVVQTGNDNESFVTQIHNGNTGGNAEGPIEVYVEQSGNKNSATQVQGPHNQLGNLYAEILQSGNHNTAEQYQVKYKNVAKIDQSGNNNVAKQAQDTKLPDDIPGSSNNATINQSGNSNTALQEQHGWDAIANATQTGDKNLSIQNQGVNGLSAWVNRADVVQDGDNNKAFQNQNGNLNYATINQSANSSTAVQNQTSSSVKRPGVNYTPYNKAEIYQSGGKGNLAVQDQDSPGGDIEMNYAIIVQDGSNNKAYQNQTDYNNDSYIFQIGYKNFAENNQTGVPYNISNIMQVGNGNSSSVNQTH
jgi:hypothetical protein